MQPSAPEREPKHFLKTMLPSAIHATQIRIPQEFVARFGDELSSVATINVPDGRVWKMRLKKCGKDVVFCNQWQEFVEYYSISFGYHLVFRYEGNSRFHVIIFDITCAEICYPCTNEEPNLDNNIHPNCASKTVHDQSETRKRESSSHGKQVKNGCSSSKRPKVATNKLKPKIPSITSTIKQARLYVGRKFAVQYLKPKDCVKLKNCKGEEWDVSCIWHGRGGMLITRGWTKFVRDNDLSEGDPCVLELIKRKPVVLKLTLCSS